MTVLSVTSDGGGGIAVAFDRDVDVNPGSDLSFIFPFLPGNIVWNAGSGNVQTGSVGGGDPRDEYWAWVPGGGYVFPDTAGTQSGTVGTT